MFLISKININSDLSNKTTIYKTTFSLTTDQWGQINVSLIINYWDKVLSIVPDNTNLMILQCGYVARVFVGIEFEPYVNQEITGTINYYI